VNDPARSDDFEIFFSAAYVFDLEKRKAELEANFPSDAKKRHLQLSRMIEVERGFDPMAPEPEAVKHTDAMIEEASRGKNRRKNAAKKGKLLVTRTRPKLPLKQNGERTSNGSKARRRPV
jgi:hypothetical protein